MTECRHDKTTIVKLNRIWHPFGMKSKGRIGLPPKKCTEFCDRCGRKLFRWKTT